MWALAVLGARETGIGQIKVFEDEDDRIAYLIASFTLLTHLREFVELKNKSYKALERLEKAVESGICPKRRVGRPQSTGRGRGGGKEDGERSHQQAERNCV
ncbi:hypothetical protein [Pyrobaculum aerophilum]|uniref:hypothetical protein n=1 Tax=Pyrobaculum aerophilum TaxID=13773 RepID=UPI002161B7FC|nr:hypothetical protein [Pyrobaculum aerophilum]